jgi:type IV secretory pathway protease TraF
MLGDDWNHNPDSYSLILTLTLTLTIRTVPAGMLMMLGDNRNHSFDSHVWGFLPERSGLGLGLGVKLEG